MNLTKAIAILTAILVGIVALMAFTLSYYTLQEVALANGIPLLLSYIWPLLIDFSLVVFSLTVVTANLHNETTWKQWTLVGVYTIATIFFNTLHAWPTLLPLLVSKILVTCVPPLSLFFSFELLMNQLKNSVSRQVSIPTNDSEVVSSYEPTQEVIDNAKILMTNIDLLTDTSAPTNKIDALANLLTTDPKPTNKELAQSLGVSTATIGNWKRELAKNGHN